MKQRRIRHLVIFLLAAVMLLSSCTPAGSPTAPATQPQPAETTAEKPAETTPAAVTTPAAAETLPPETTPAPTPEETTAAPETTPAKATTPEQTVPTTKPVPETPATPTPEETTAVPETTTAPTPVETTQAEIKAPSFSSWLAETDGISTLRGESGPSANLGETEDSYTDLGTLDVYWKETQGWKKLGNLEENGYYLVYFASASGTDVPEPLIVKEGSKLEQPALAFVSGRTFEGWYGEGITGKWDFQKDTVQKSMTLTAVYTDPVDRQTAKLQLKDVRVSSGIHEGVNAAVVIFLGYTDGLPLDRNQFEAFFNGDYGPERAMESLSTYYKYNSYGKISMEYYFYYFDTGMGCKEAYDYTEDSSKAVGLLHEAFKEFQQNYNGDLKDWDRNGDGFVDMLYFISGEDPCKTVGDGTKYYIYGSGAAPTESNPPDPEKPAIRTYAKLTYDGLLEETIPGTALGDFRNLLHETGHIFGLEDYYNSRRYEDENYFEPLGSFDMQDSDMGDWNVYSRFAAGWLDPYVIDGSQDEVTLRIGCSSRVPDAILIPTGAGWNGTAFDEYIMVDVLAPYAGNAFDWEGLCEKPLVKSDDPRLGGGVRVYHVDSRLVRVEIGSPNLYQAVDTYDELLQVTQEEGFNKHGIWLWQRFWNSDGIDPTLPGDPRGMHMIEIVPSDGSGRFRGKDPIMYWKAMDTLLVNDLYGPGDVFSMEACSGSFFNAPLMNNGSTFDYEVEVNFYDPDTQEAIVTVRKIR